MIYFIADTQEGPIKIGTTRALESRVKSLQSATHRELILIGAIEGDHKVEALFHRAFCRQHLRNEWFTRTDEMERVIRDAVLRGFGFVEPYLRELAKDSWGINQKSEDGLRRIREAVSGKPRRPIEFSDYAGNGENGNGEGK